MLPVTERVKGTEYLKVCKNFRFGPHKCKVDMDLATETVFKGLKEGQPELSTFLTLAKM